MSSDERGISTQQSLRDEVHKKYRAAAQSAVSGSCCAPQDTASFGAALYQVRPDEVPDTALLASLGCGNPTAVAELQPGERVLDLGSGAGTDVILSARRVGPSGKVYGLDFVDEMLLLARDNVRAAGVTNVELLKGLIEAIPLPPESVDVVISNCVVNLSTDKSVVFREITRVLLPGGRVGIADVVAEDRLTPQERAQRGGYAECIAGALSVSEYQQLLTEAGLVGVTVDLTHEVADGMHGAIVRARKPD
jgi:arsenite methyltransferase